MLQEMCVSPLNFFVKINVIIINFESVCGYLLLYRNTIKMYVRLRCLIFLYARLIER